jgi:decaprenylphospho-beta-D-ribofuranose 2-oxidase
VPAADQSADARDGDLSPVPCAGRPGLLSGWGLAHPTFAVVAAPRTPGEATEAWADALGDGRPVIARGLGRAYNDASQCAGGVVVDMTACDRILEADLERGIIRAEAGLSLDALLRWCVPRGWFVPVTPGTRFVTLGGALAADIHGKNHHRDGSIALAIRSFTLLAPSGRRQVTAAGDPEVFWATAGGMGLTGLVVDVTLQLVAIETSQMVVDTDRVGDLDETMRLMSEGDDGYRYSVAWLDCLARGRHLGRSVLTRAEHASLEDLGSEPGRGARVVRPLDYAPRRLLTVPLTPPVRPLNLVSIAAFNEFWFRKAPRHRTGELQGIAPFFHPLDGVVGWNRLYGPAGFTQYQFVVPFGRDDVVRRVVEELSDRRLGSFLAVLKRFGPGNDGPLSFPAPGWTLALDLPLGIRGLAELLDQFDELVAEAGGRIYLAKDARVRPSTLRAMYPRIDEWQSVRDSLDPSGQVSSDLGRRLGLVRSTRSTPGGAS